MRTDTVGTEPLRTEGRIPAPLAHADTAGLAVPEPGGDDGAAEPTIARKQLALLFAYCLVNWATGNGLLPLLPKYATQLGANDAVIGIYLSASYAAIALGTLAAGWLADRVGHRRMLMVLVGLAIPPLLLALSQTPAFWGVVALTAAIWWFAGMALTLASIVAGLGAATGQRGQVLGFLAVAAPTGSIIGGLGIGVLADTLGFSGMWIALAAVYLLCPATAVLVREVPTASLRAGRRPPRPRAAWSPAFLILLVCGVLASFGSLLSALGRTLAMQDVFTNTELTSTVAVSGAATLPFPFLLGFLSDRLGRLPFLGLCYAAGVAGLIVYSGAASLWQFWLASGLVAFVSYVSTGVGSALVVDLVGRDAVGRGLALFNATGWVGGVLGFAVGGLLFPALGFANAFLFGAVLLAVAVLLLPPIASAMRSARSVRGREQTAEAAARKE